MSSNQWISSKDNMLKLLFKLDSKLLSEIFIESGE
jgi:hypothetical protein